MRMAGLPNRWRIRSRSHFSAAFARLPRGAKVTGAAADRSAKPEGKRSAESRGCSAAEVRRVASPMVVSREIMDVPFNTAPEQALSRHFQYSELMRYCESPFRGSSSATTGVVIVLDSQGFISLIAGIALIVLLTFGARWLVDGAVTIAKLLGMSELLIGLSIVAAGTSLPEVATLIASGAFLDIVDGEVGMQPMLN